MNRIETTIQSSLPTVISNFSKLPKPFQEACIAVCMQGVFTASMPKLHSRVEDLGIRTKKGKISPGFVKDQGTRCGKAHAYLHTLGIITSDTKWKVPNLKTGKGGLTRVYHLSDDFYSLILTNYAPEKKLTISNRKYHQNTCEEFITECKSWFSYSKNYHKNAEVKLVKQVVLDKEDKLLLDNIKLGARLFASAMTKCQKKIAYQNTKPFLSGLLNKSDMESPEFTYQKALSLSSNNITDSCRAVQGRRGPVDMETKRENNYNAFINILSGVDLTVTQDRCGRLHTGSWENLSLHYRKYLLRDTDTYNVDGVCCQLVFISNIIGSNFSESYKALNGASIWQNMNLGGLTKSEAKELIYTFNFTGKLSRAMSLKREQFFKANQALFGDYIDKLKAFHKRYTNNRYHKHANDLIFRSQQGLVVNALGLPFSPEKNLVSYTDKKTLVTHSYMKMKNISGKYLAHLAQGQEQQIFQEIFAKLEYAFGYQYDGFFFIPDSAQDIYDVEQTCKHVATSFGFPELNFCIQKLSQM